MPRLSISLIGSFRATLDGEPVTNFATVKVQALLAYLSVEADRAHSREALATLLWPKQPRKKGRQSLRQALYRLRQALDDHDAVAPQEASAQDGSPFLLFDRRTIQFNANSDHWLDMAAFISLDEACQQHRHRHPGTCLPCLKRMETMVALYQGEFLEQLTAADSRLFEEWVLLRREWLHRQAMEALVCLAHWHERRGELDQARTYAHRQVEMEPWREEAHRQLMQLLAREGQRSAALAQYQACHTALAEELGIEPTQETTRLYEKIKASTSHRPLPLNRQTSLRPRKGALPPSPTPFVGRETELAELAELLANPDCRLITLIGTGGVGKTRLALQAAANQIGSFAHGVAFVPLTSVCSVDLLISTIADALDFSFGQQQEPEQQLLNYLREKELLLVLDGMERILEGADLLAKILHRAPGVLLLTTSQERLKLREEWVRDVQGLAYPQRRETDDKASECTSSDVQEEPTEHSALYSALQLFQQHACRVHQRFSLSEPETRHVARICQLVEGLPLGIELAAAWAGVRSCKEIAEEIERNLDFLSTTLRNIPDRQRSIRATFEHSWQLLSQDEKDLLAQLSVFRGGFGREAALRVTGASLSILLALIDKSLVRRVAPDRYDMQGRLTQFAAEKGGDGQG